MAHWAENILSHSPQRKRPVSGKSCLTFLWRGRSLIFSIFCTASNNAGETMGSNVPSNHSLPCFTKPRYARLVNMRLMDHLASGVWLDDITPKSAKNLPSEVRVCTP